MARQDLSAVVARVAPLAATTQFTPSSHELLHFSIISCCLLAGGGDDVGLHQETRLVCVVFFLD
ncbi:hypothetical protein ACS0TY_021747 [Phlomoides rotata]